MSDQTDGIIHIEYNHVHNAADNIMTQTVALETMLDNLEMELTALSRSWVGDDNIQYAAKQAEWDESVRAMKRELDSYSHLLVDISDDYRRNEQRLAEAFQDVWAR
jgi:WXG100 family type VII secretion target